MIGIKAVGFANGADCPHSGLWVKSFDFDAFGGQGYGVFTADPAQALPFTNKADAFTFWQTTSRFRPRREDGKPNRPLTSLTVLIEELPT